MRNTPFAVWLVMTWAWLSASGAEKSFPSPVSEGLPFSAFVDTNLVAGIWNREYSGDAATLHKEGVEEFLAVIVAFNAGRRQKLFFHPSEVAFYLGRAFVALSKLDLTNQLDLVAYKEFLLLSFAPSKGGYVVATAAERHDLLLLGKSTHSYMAKRLYLLSKIGHELDQRYTSDAQGNQRRMVEPMLDHPSNPILFRAATNAATLFRQTMGILDYRRTRM